MGPISGQYLCSKNGQKISFNVKGYCRSLQFLFCQFIITLSFRSMVAIYAILRNLSSSKIITEEHWVKRFLRLALTISLLRNDRQANLKVAFAVSPLRLS